MPVLETLEHAVSEHRKTIKSERYSMSIGELEGMYTRGEIDIHPKFQRILRWSDEQKTRLIESILLNIPIPPIYVSQDAQGRWDVVDGAQRLGTIFEFLGVLKGPDGDTKPPLVLAKTELLPQLKNGVFAENGHAHQAFTPTLRLDFRRARLDVHILLRESTTSTKYELFERLNTGGSLASPQEVRNCVLVWINEDLFDWMRRELVDNRDFQACLKLSDRRGSQQYDWELVLRFLSLYQAKPAELKNIQDIGEYLDDKNRGFALDTEFDRQGHTKAFQTTFDYLEDALGDEAFCKYEPQAERFKGGFLISAFEAVAMGVAHNLSAWVKCKDRSARLRACVKTLWDHQPFLDAIGPGVPARERIRETVVIGRKMMKP